ncbi:MAG: FHIPEP family type III secretion protein [Deltaproteobacteria bacterium]|nr:FHIPEP family type III secretion protein [Deltaproteobacteria bacterium]
MKPLVQSNLRELFLAVVILAIVAMMIIPLSPWMMDLLISFNLGISMLIFAMAVFQKNPLHFSGFPSVLLMATLYRLALNISSTRLILTRGNPGRIIGGFGGFIVGGDIIVGAVIFGVILMVLFLVITRGAERVAEVAARFTLDALPGMQMAIEADLRSKTISPRELTLRREALEKRSMYYGSLDGAMKFVRGDAVAALVITVINVLGGTLVGVLRKNMSIADALDLYGRLTVGDGLVSMIPALLISTAAGLLVTRLAQGHSSGDGDGAMGMELLSVPSAIIAAAAMMLLLALIPGLPAWPFLIAASVLAVSVAVQKRLSEGVATRITSPNIRRNEAAISLDRMQQLLDEVAARHPVLVREAVWERIELAMLADIIGELKMEGISEQHLPDVLEAIAREKVVADLDDMLVRIRRRLAYLITESLQHDMFSAPSAAPANTAEKRDGSMLRITTVDVETEQLLQASVVSTSAGKRMTLQPDLEADLVDNLNQIVEDKGPQILLVSASLRRPLQQLLPESVKHIRVIGHGEITPSVPVEVCAQLSL